MSETTEEDGHLYAVEIEYNTDFDGREIDPGKEEYPRTLHGPFLTKDLAIKWLEDYPEDTDVHDMSVIPLNLVPQES